MAIQVSRTKKKHFPDLLFYLISALFIVAITLAIINYDKSETLYNLVNVRTDSLIWQRAKTKEQSAIYENQGKLVIRNTGTYKFRIAQLYVTYYDTTQKILKTVNYIVDNYIAEGGSCSPVYWDGRDQIWAGQVLFYSLFITGTDIDEHINQRFFCGNWIKGQEFLGISLNNQDNGTGRLASKCDPTR